MPQVRNATLALPRNGNNVTINIAYDAVFTEFERRLAGLGLRFQEQMTLIGVDPPGGFVGLNVFTVVRTIPVTNGAGELSVHRTFANIVSRNSLDEDPSPFGGPDFDQDEYRVRIRIVTVGFPPAATPDAFSTQATIGGLVIGQEPAAAATA